METGYKVSSIGAAQERLSFTFLLHSRFLSMFAKFFYFYFWHLAPLAEGEGHLQQK
ncbi:MULTISPECIES: hypothetical protein [Ralstonia solanacearum species complex]|uniref:Uncharacterized protein n=1 Tax=Ralstonia syzygii TaxID=28097 RepID=A0ABX7ZC36_9RALS|nr:MULTISPECIES: hypothetical protein [Ralstonia solanacearum species complex]QQV56732.1 hypothetical protein JK151_07320 [Ralstonia syzygii subsp. celebesensis]QUP52950.1 hypothetical protein GO998_03860 [Ralstonia syzygii]